MRCAPEHQLVYVPGVVVVCLLISRLGGYLGVHWLLSYYQAPQQSGLLLTIIYIISLVPHRRCIMVPRLFYSSSFVGTVKRLPLLIDQLLDIKSFLLLRWRDVDLIVAEEELAR